MFIKVITCLLILWTLPLYALAQEQPIRRSSQIAQDALSNVPTKLGLASEIAPYLTTYFLTNRQVKRTQEASARSSGSILRYDDNANSAFAATITTGITAGWVELSVSKAGNYSGRGRGMKTSRKIEISRLGLFDDLTSFELSRAQSPSEKTAPPLFYVHGFNHNFREAAETMGALLVDLSLPQSSVFFSWPSEAGRLSLSFHPSALNEAAYRAARNVSPYTAWQIQKILPKLCSSNSPMNALGHSMGADVLTMSLTENFGNPSTTTAHKFNQLLLPAADISTSDFFQRRLAKLLPQSRVVVYCADDGVLAESASWNSSDARLGYCKAAATVVEEGLEVIHVHGNLGPLAAQHSYYLWAQPVLNHQADTLKANPIPKTGSRNNVITIH